MVRSESSKWESSMLSSKGIKNKEDFLVTKHSVVEEEN